MDDDPSTKLYNRRTHLKALGTAAAGSLAGCLGSGNGDGNGGGSPEGPIEVLTWNLGFLEESINGWIEDFEKDHDVKGKWVDKPAEDFPTYFQSQIQAGTPPDTIDTQGSIYVQYARDGVLEPLDDITPDDIKNRFGDAMLKRSTVDGKLWRLPFYHVSTGTVYRKKWFDEAGLTNSLPTTTDEYFQAAEKIANETDAEWGMTLVRFDYALWPFFWAEGIDVLNEDNTKAAFNKQKTVDILNRFRELTDDGVIPELTWTQRKQPQAKEFGTGNTGMYHMWLSSVRLVQNAGDWVNGDTMGFMAPPGGKAAYQGHGWSITKDHNQATKEAAMDMIGVIANEKWQKDFLRNTTVLVGNQNAVKSLAENDEFRNENPLLAGVYDTWFDVADTAVAQPQISAVSQIWDIIDSEFSAAAVGEKSAEKAISAAESQVNNALD